MGLVLAVENVELQTIVEGEDAEHVLGEEPDHVAPCAEVGESAGDIRQTEGDEQSRPE